MLGPVAPARPATGAGSVAAAATGTPAPAVQAAVVPAPSTGAPATPSTPALQSPLPPGADPLLGQLLAGRYVLHRKLGEGGMGSVYLATHSVLEKQVALKVLHGEFARKPDLVERFMQEAKAASRIRHENVIDISDFGHTPEGLVFFAMELLTGHDLHEEIARARLAGQLLAWERSKRIFLQICAALSAAHALGIIHRDLKPENIYLVEFLGEPDFVKLLDFGIAKLTEITDGERKLTRTGMLFGTPEYMSPEQARGDAVDHRVDVYAMGCILFQLVTGRVPFEAENFMGVLTQHLTQPVPVIPPDVFDSIGAPRAIAQVIEHALAKDRDRRVATIDELARAVRRASGDKPTGVVPAQGTVPAPPSTAALGRLKTQWTGNLSVPPADVAPATRSRLPVVLGALLLAGGAAAAIAVLVSRGGGAVATAGAPIAAASTPHGPPVVPAAAPAVPAPAVAPAAAAPLPFERAQIQLDSAPSRAEVRDLATGAVIGVTPLAFTLPASRTPRQFGLHHKDYVDTVVEIVPERDEIKHTEKLVRGSAAAPAVVHHASPPAPGPVPVTRPEAGSPAAEPPAIQPAPAAEPARPEPPPAPSDSDAILLKPDPSRTGTGSGSGSP